jgi:hypothetical protein
MDDREIAEAVEEYQAAKAAEDQAKTRREDAQDRVATLLEAAGYKTRTVDFGDERFRVTRTASDYVKAVNEKGLKKALGAKVWRLVTDVKLSQPKLKAQIEAGVVDAQLAAMFIETATKKPSITVTLLKEEN